MTSQQGLSDAYRTLELQPGCSFTEVRRAYLDLVQVWHPDRFASASARLQTAAQEKFLRINEAYNVLKHHVENAGSRNVEVATPDGQAWAIEWQGESHEGLAVAGFRSPRHAQLIYGYVDGARHIVIEPRFSDAADFSEGLAAVRMVGTLFWGFIKPSGEFAIDPQYVYAGNFVGGRARVSLGGPLTYIDKPGPNSR